MPVHVQLSQDKRYLIYEIAEPLNMDDMMRAYQDERHMRDSLPYVIHSIVDISQVKRIPINWLTAKAGPGLTHPRSGEMVFVGLSLGIKTIVETVLRIANYRRMKFFGTRAEAETYMKELVAKTPLPVSEAQVK